MKKVAVLLSGNGVFDGAEINEAVLTLLALEESGLEYQCFAPNRNQHHVINHVTGEEMPESRNIMIEASRIVRGNIQSLAECKADDFSALLVVGGFGVAKNFSDLAFKGQELSVAPDFMSVCSDFKEENRVCGYMCIAPALLPLIYNDVETTIGNDKDTVSCIESLGGKHICAKVDEVVIDVKNKVVTTPAYMLATNLVDAKKGIDKLVMEVKSMILSA